MSYLSDDRFFELACQHADIYIDWSVACPEIAIEYHWRNRLEKSWSEIIGKKIRLYEISPVGSSEKNRLEEINQRKKRLAQKLLDDLLVINTEDAWKAINDLGKKYGNSQRYIYQFIGHHHAILASNPILKPLVTAHELIFEILADTSYDWVCGWNNMQTALERKLILPYTINFNTLSSLIKSALGEERYDQISKELGQRRLEEGSKIQPAISKASDLNKQKPIDANTVFAEDAGTTPCGLSRSDTLGATMHHKRTRRTRLPKG